ncbi:hypothetical protein RSOL_504920 [Rhizoctonia solani AG-3 Rhs1AP]|uniref:Uncharacterized protein n=1 Tax=Rhizoctonia solani AG-3 Rhs1AP TaxID=1086054 RepID=X8JQK5_9AGAM|nr:hypothetical protein RSOL_504920 [Rhizoctonia solani AG-3 Rhs1AP]
MVPPLNSNTSNAPAPAQNDLRRRSIRSATELVAKSAAEFVEIPALKDSVQVARDIIGAFKEPVRNDILAQNLTDYLDEILLCTRAADANQVNSEYLEDLQQIKTAIVMHKNKTYRTKLVRQQDIGRELEKRKEEIMERTLLFSEVYVGGEAMLGLLNSKHD